MQFQTHNKLWDTPLFKKAVLPTNLYIRSKKARIDAKDVEHVSGNALASNCYANSLLSRLDLPIQGTARLTILVTVGYKDELQQRLMCGE